MWYSVSGSRFFLHITGIHLSPFPENDEKRGELLRSLYLNDKKSRKVSFWNKTDKHTKIVYILLYWKVVMLMITRIHNQNFEVTPTIYLIPHEDINQPATLKHICIYVFIFLYYCYLRETFLTILWKGKLTIRFFNFILLDDDLKIYTEHSWKFYFMKWQFYFWAIDISQIAENVLHIAGTNEPNSVQQTNPFFLFYCVCKIWILFLPLMTVEYLCTYKSIYLHIYVCMYVCKSWICTYIMCPSAWVATKPMLW